MTTKLSYTKLNVELTNVFRFDMITNLSYTKLNFELTNTFGLLSARRKRISTKIGYI